MDKSENLKARTIGVSFPPEVKKRADVRTEALGLSFSRYVTLCVEAELSGQISQLLPEEGLDLDRAIQRARSYMDSKALAVGFESDVEALIHKAGWPCERFARLDGGIRTDFLLTPPWGAKRPRIAVECRYHIKANYALAIGQTLVLKAHPEVDSVVLTVPYMEGFDSKMLGLMRKEQIYVTTIDTLPALINELFDKMEIKGGIVGVEVPEK